MPNEQPDPSEVFELDLDVVSEDNHSISAPVKEPSGPFNRGIHAAATKAVKALAALESREAAKKLEDELNSDAEAKFSEEKRKNPRLAGFGQKVRVIAYRKAPKGFYKEPAHLVRTWLEIPANSLSRNGIQTIASIQNRYPGFTVSKNFLTRTLHWAQIKHVRQMLKNAGVEISLKDSAKLATIRLRLIDHFEAPDYDVTRLKVYLAKDGSHIIWNNKRYKVFDNSGVPTIKRDGKKIAVSTIRRVLGMD